MAKKKSLISQALIEAKELENAAMENAKEMVLESFTPDFQEFFKSVLTEAEDAEYEDDEDEDEDEEDLEEGNEHDMGKYPDPGREGTDPALDDDEEQGTEYQVSEGEYDDVKGDATPEKGQAGLPNKPKVKQTGEDGWEDEGYAGKGMPSKRESQDGTPSTKQTEEGWEDEGYYTVSKKQADPEKGGKNGLDLPTPPVKIAEGEEEEDGEEEPDELDVPDELFDDEEDESEDDDDIDLDIEDDDEEEDDEDKDEVNEEDEPDFEVEDDDDDNEESEDEEDEDDDDSMNEGLYVKTNAGKFRKVTPVSYLNNRMTSLEEQHDRDLETIDMLKSQLQETTLYNAKLAHLNKLVMTGVFTNTEKTKIMESLDECESIDEVKKLFARIINEVEEQNPLDGFSKVIKEHRSRREAKTDNVYESADLKRMRAIINYRYDKG